MTIATVRFYVGDTETPYLLTDEQITLAIDATSSDFAAAAMCARALAARYARQVDTRFETISSNYSQRSRSFERLARNLEGQARVQNGMGEPLAGGISRAEDEAARSNTDRVKPFFHDAMFTNPPAPNSSTPYDED